MGANYAMKQARAQKGLSQQALADALGVSRQTISAIEKGDDNPLFGCASASAKSWD